MVEHISAPTYTPSHSISLYPSPILQKKTQNEFTQFVSPTQHPSYFPSPLSMAITSDPFVVLSDIPSTGSSNLLLSPVPYLIPNHSLLGPNLLPPLLQTEYFLPPDYRQCHPQKNYIKTQVMKPSHPKD